MFKKLLSILFIITLPFSVFAGGVDKILAKVDDYRSPYINSKLKISVISYKGNKTDKKTSYTIYSTYGKNLVLIESGSSKGNRVLLIDKGMYLATKKSSRPIRITPLQRLMGQASYGDLASLRMEKSYSGEIASKSDNEIILDLKATKKSATYKKLKLYVGANYQPLKMEAYLTSGKLFKQMKYNVKNGRVQSIIYTDPKQPNKKTVMKFISVENKKLHRKFFTSKGMKNEIQ